MTNGPRVNSFFNFLLGPKEPVMVIEDEQQYGDQPSVGNYFDDYDNHLMKTLDPEDYSYVWEDK